MEEADLGVQWVSIGETKACTSESEEVKEEDRKVDSAPEEPPQSLSEALESEQVDTMPKVPSVTSDPPPVAPEEDSQERQSPLKREKSSLLETPVVQTGAVNTVPVVTGESSEKKVKVEEEIARLRKMSQEFINTERKRSIDMLALPTQEEGFSFSEDGDDFDVPDTPL